MPPIFLEQVTKRFRGGVTAVRDLNLQVQAGQLFGFLGPNGAGKTTTMRMLVGLVRPSSGTVRVLGQRPGAPEALARIGALIETPTFYPHLSGQDNLRLVARYAGIPASRVQRVLSEVGLAERAHSRFRTYSLGMKQRLGVAAALLKDPEVLILDEPTNGLDPSAVVEMRDLLRTIGSGGRTVLLSSHQLWEVEQICDRVAVIDAGQLVTEGTVAELRTILGAGSVVIDATPTDRALSLLQEQDVVQAVEVSQGVLHVTADPAHIADLNRCLVEAGIDVHELRPVRHSLEDAFLKLTGSERSDPATGQPALEQVS